jgi:CubicO group peptidase (beta-lactamase class C family)
MIKRIISFFIISILLCCCTQREKETALNADLEKKIDSFARPYTDNSKVAGMVIGVFKDHKPLLLKGYGFADLEFDVKMPANASFEIGSVTKQFTGAAILQLAEQEKLSLEDDFTKYVDFETHGKKVTIRQLLSHTSGIKGYTELPLFKSISIEKHKRDTLLRLVEKEAFDFEPGEALIYNNTAFFILGLIIEKVSGQSYEEYLSENLFSRAGMTHTYYCSENKITPNRAHGYDGGEKGLVRAAYLDHTWPYAAGSLCSTVEDLEKWNEALHHGKILNEKTYEEFITPISLNDGTVTHYAKGITVTDWKGKRLIEHGGGINGFLSQNSYFPDEDVSIVVLINSTTQGPREIADQIAGLLFGKTLEDDAPAFPGDHKKFTGTYVGRGRGSDIKVIITNDDTTLFVQIDDRPMKKLSYVKDNLWSDGGSTYLFKGNGDIINELRIDQTYGYLILKKE